MLVLRKKIQLYIKKEAVLCISGFIALITMLFVPPSASYLDYIDFRVLALLFCLMAVVAGFNETGVFLALSEKLLRRVSTTRGLSFVLVMLCFFTSMWITNDVALITFVPFTIMLLTVTGQTKYVITITVLETIAANLGSMLTPVGNPQNLFLYSFYHYSIGEFLFITLPYTLAALLLLCVSALLIKKENLEVSIPDSKKADRKKLSLIVMYSLLFLVCLFCVLHILDYRIMLLIVFLTVLLIQRRVLKMVDYSLLLTFIFFFIFVGNLGSLPIIKDFLSDLIHGRELVVTIAASQVISNVPAALLLSAFTDKGKALILGTDLGGLGTIIASLASLISFKFYIKTEGAKPGKYLLIFTLYNLIFLAGLLLFYLLLN